MTDQPPALLESIIARAVDPGAIIDVMEQFALEKTIVTPGLAGMARMARVRVQHVDGTWYIFCPIPAFYDDARNLETGFAIDVDQDHFDVYPFMYHERSGKHLILSRLPHCVVKAIKVAGTDYRAVDDALKAVANESSAILFISNLYTELAAGLDSPIEFFDNRLFQQLVGKVLGVKDAGWMNRTIAIARFKQLVHQLDRLDERSPFHEASQARAFTHLAWFLFETGRLVQFDELFTGTDRDALHSILQPVMARAIASHDIDIAKEIARNACPGAPRNVLAPVFSLAVAGGHLDLAMAIEQAAGSSFCKDPGIARDVLVLVLRDPRAITNIETITSFLGVPFSPDPGELQQASDALVLGGHVSQAQELERLARLPCKPGEGVVHAAIPLLLDRGAISEAIALERWSGVKPTVPLHVVTGAARRLLANGEVHAARQLAAWTGIEATGCNRGNRGIEGILGTDVVDRTGLGDARVDDAGWPPGPAEATSIISNLVRHGLVDAAIEAARWMAGMVTGGKGAGEVPAPGHDDVQAGYAVLLPDASGWFANATRARRLGTWTGMLPRPDIVYELHASILHALIDDDRKVDEAMSLASWTGVLPSKELIVAEYKAALKPSPLKGLNVALARRLCRWTRFPIPAALAATAFATLLSPPIRDYSLSDAAQLSTLTGWKPAHAQVQVAYRAILERQVIDMKEEPVQAARRLESWTGIPPSDPVVQASQDLAMLRGDIALAIDIHSWKGCKPAMPVVRDALAMFLQHPDPAGTWFDTMQRLICWTGIAPGEDMMQRAFEALLLGRWLTPGGVDAAARLALLTGVKPMPRTFQKALEKLAMETRAGYSRVEAARSLDAWSRRLECHG
ncbi:MAG: hypothetical protein GYA24_11015 [Candidatus Lokiarchaeota archaeon]|nr:hypothetical protein [Candidatus Lokiarchaeota archaeon]